MKKLFVFAFAMIISLHGFTQFSKGSNLLGGCVVYSGSGQKTSGSNSQTSQFNYTINPEYNHLLSDNWSIGLGLGFSGFGNKTTNDNNGITSVDKSNTGTFFAEPMVRYYHGWNDKLYCYGSAGVLVGVGSTKNTEEVGSTSTVTKFNNSEVVVEIKPGFSYFFDPHLALDLNYGSLYFSENATKPKDSDTKSTNDGYGLNLNFKTLTIGFVYLFDCD